MMVSLAVLGVIVGFLLGFVIGYSKAKRASRLLLLMQLRRRQPFHAPPVKISGSISTDIFVVAVEIFAGAIRAVLAPFVWIASLFGRAAIVLRSAAHQAKGLVRRALKHTVLLCGTFTTASGVRGNPRGPLRIGFSDGVLWLNLGRIEFTRSPGSRLFDGAYHPRIGPWKRKGLRWTASPLSSDAEADRRLTDLKGLRK